ncbi:MAG: hypothetical protein OXU71_05280, partial [Gammaproteobacteria bacterium]|nr:hypothetical protein [Gammaproteobacteria bacterium]
CLRASRRTNQARARCFFSMRCGWDWRRRTAAVNLKPGLATVARFAVKGVEPRAGHPGDERLTISGWRYRDATSGRDIGSTVNAAAKCSQPPPSTTQP